MATSKQVQVFNVLLGGDAVCSRCADRIWSRQAVWDDDDGAYRCSDPLACAREFLAKHAHDFPAV